MTYENNAITDSRKGLNKLFTEFIENDKKCVSSAHQNHDICCEFKE